MNRHKKWQSYMSFSKSNPSFCPVLLLSPVSNFLTTWSMILAFHPVPGMPPQLQDYFLEIQSLLLESILGSSWFISVTSVLPSSPAFWSQACCMQTSPYQCQQTYPHPQPCTTLPIPRYFIWLYEMACEILLPQPGIEPVPPAGEVRSLNHWTTREVLAYSQILLFFCH